MLLLLHLCLLWNLSRLLWLLVRRRKRKEWQDKRNDGALKQRLFD